MHGLYYHSLCAVYKGTLKCKRFNSRLFSLMTSCIWTVTGSNNIPNFLLFVQDTRLPEEYDVSHLPGAVRVDPNAQHLLESLHIPPNTRGTLPPPGGG